VPVWRWKIKRTHCSSLIGFECGIDCALSCGLASDKAQAKTRGTRMKPQQLQPY
jgi:hypothetical protein